MLKLFSLYGAATVAIALLNISSVNAQTAGAPPLAQQTASAALWTKSIKITAGPVQQSDLGMLMLGSDLWRFTIAGPRPLCPVDLIVELQEKGKPTVLLVSATVKPQSGWPTNGHLQILVGQSSSDYSLKASARARYMVQANGYTFASSANRIRESGFTGPVLAMTSTDNLFNGAVQTDKVIKPHQRPDGSFVLLTGGKSVTEAKKDVPEMALVFRVQEEAPAFKQAKNN